MKKFITCIIVLGVIFGGVAGYFLVKDMLNNKKIEEIKKGWYIEVIHDVPINVRDQASTKGKTLGTVSKGEVYKVLDVDTISSNTFFWYKIEYNNTKGYVASGRKIHWVNDYNNPNDIQVPTIRFKEGTYKVASIADINYKHLEVIEDTDDYKITHQIYHEVKPSEYIDQYWILYTITDGAGKSSSKMQKIEFDVKPDESQVLDFSEYKK